MRRKTSGRMTCIPPPRKAAGAHVRCEIWLPCPCSRCFLFFPSLVRCALATTGRGDRANSDGRAGSGSQNNTRPTYFFALLLAPCDHFSSSATSFLASSSAAFCAATSAFRALPAAFLLLSNFPDVLPIATGLDSSCRAMLLSEMQVTGAARAIGVDGADRRCRWVT
jgi:hypothetical protein